MNRRKKNSGLGYGMEFHGAFKKKSDAVAKEAKRKGSFIKPTRTAQGFRYIVMSQRTNPRKKASRVNGATGSTPAARRAWGKANRMALKASKASQRALEAVGRKSYDKLVAKFHEFNNQSRQAWAEFERLEHAAIARHNPAELVVLGANPHMVSNPMNPGSGFSASLAKSLGLSQGHAGLIRTKKQKRLAAFGRRRRGSSPKSSSFSSDVYEALRGQGYKAGVARKAAKSARGGDFDSVFRSALDHLRSNPDICGHPTGAGSTYPCTRKPGHKGPHLPQGATMRTAARLPHHWRGKNVERGNPSAEAIRESFVGKPVEKITVHDEPHMPAGDYAKLGDLMGLSIKPVGGGAQKGLYFFEGRYNSLMEAARDLVPLVGPPSLVSDESKEQMYFVGGDQSWIGQTLTELGAKQIGSGIYELGTVHLVVYREKKSFDDFQLVNYVHKLGEESDVRPTLLWDANSKRMLLEGGEYRVTPEGIRN